jgi:hypothetical protein
VDPDAETELPSAASMMSRPHSTALDAEANTAWIALGADLDALVAGDFRQRDLKEAVDHRGRRRVPARSANDVKPRMSANRKPRYAVTRPSAGPSSVTVGGWS